MNDGVIAKDIDTRLRPALVPVKCVVCNGWAKVNWGKAVCHACEGKGYILVPVQKEERPYDDLE